MFKNILVPTDGSPVSRKAARKAIAMAQALGARITAFHAAPAYRPNLYAEYMPPNVETPVEYAARAKAVAERYLHAIEAMADRSGVPCEGHYTTSDFPAEAIVKAARQYRCDAIAIATHGRSGLSRLLLGSETTKVLGHARTPVIVMR